MDPWNHPDAHNKVNRRNRIQHQYAFNILDGRARLGPSSCGMWEVIHLKGPGRWGPGFPGLRHAHREAVFDIGYLHPECPEGLSCETESNGSVCSIYLSSLSSCIRLGPSDQHLPGGACPGAKASGIFSPKQHPRNISLRYRGADVPMCRIGLSVKEGVFRSLGGHIEGNADIQVK